jgi:ABC-type transport system substrate-binding protein
MERRTLLAVSLLAATLALAACGGASTVAPSTATSGSTPAAQPSAASASQPDAPASADPGTPSSDPSAPAVSGRVDVCALLTAGDVAAIVPGAVATAGEPDGGPITSYSCTWDEASPANPIPASLSVKVSPNFISQSQPLSGFTPDLLKQITSGAAINNGGAVIDGLGDLGVVDPVSHLGPEVQFFAGDAMVSLDYSATDGLSKQDAVVAVARLVAGRLP